MATTSSSSRTTPNPPPTPPVDDRDYVNPGVFVTPWEPVYIVEDESLRDRAERELPTVDVPWDALATLKVHAPEMSRDIVICGWEGVGHIVRQLESKVLQNIRRGLRTR